MIWFKKRTVKFRHFLAKTLAPKLYQDLKEYRIFKAKFGEVKNHPRPMIQLISEINDNTPLVGCEIGVAEGLNALSILDLLPIKKLYLIDPYIPYLKDGKTFLKYVNMKEEAKQRLTFYNDRTEFIYKTSDEAVTQIPDKLDFIYIDGDHSHEQVFKDINNYYPKVKYRGVIGGHDFNLIKKEGLVRAVFDYAIEAGLKIRWVLPDWYLIKGDHT